MLACSCTFTARHMLGKGKVNVSHCLPAADSEIFSLYHLALCLHNLRQHRLPVLQRIPLTMCDQEQNVCILVVDRREKNVWAIMKLMACERVSSNMALNMHYVLHMVKLLRHRPVTVIFFSQVLVHVWVHFWQKIPVQLWFSVRVHLQFDTLLTAKKIR